MKNKQVKATLMIALLLVTGVTSIMGSVNAQESPSTCQESPSLIINEEWASPLNACSSSTTDSGDLTESGDTQANVYQNAENQVSNSKIFFNSFERYINGSKNIAFKKSKAAVVKAVKNGKNQTQAASKGVNVTTKYYNNQYKKVIAQFESDIGVWYAGYSALNESNQLAAFNYYKINYEDGSGDLLVNQVNTSVWDGVSMINNNQANYETVKANLTWSVSSGANYNKVRRISIVRGPIVIEGGAQTGDAKINKLVISSQNKSKPSEVLVNLNKYKHLRELIIDANIEVSNDLTNFAAYLIEQRKSGNLDSISSNIGSPTFGTQNTSVNNSSYQERSLMALGANPPENLSIIDRMKITYQNDQYSGLLMATQTPNNGFKVGKTYNPDIGKYYLARDNKSLLPLTGQFRIDKIIYKDGQEKTNGTIDYDNVVNNPENLEEYEKMQEDIERLQQLIEEREDPTYVSGGSNPTDNTTNWLTNKIGGIPIYGIFVLIGIIGYVGKTLRN